MNLPSYAQYKDSGAEWLGQVPQHWEVLSIKRLTPVARGASPRPIEDPRFFDDEGEYAWVRIADVTSNHHYLKETTQRLSDLGKNLSVPLEPGSLFLSVAGSVGKPMITAIKACIHDGFVYFPQLRINREFLYYIFESGQPYLGLGKLGTQLNLNTDTVGDIKIGLPSEEEQNAIAKFLYWKMGQLDALIASNKNLIEKLKEQRTAVITHAVTKGVDSNAPLRDSGIPWIGQVPKHWEIKRLKWVVMLQRGHDLPSEERNEGEIPIVSSSGVSAYHDCAIAKAPGIVTGRYGTIGVFHLIEQDYWPLNTTLYSNDLYGNCPRFLRALLENLSPLFLLNAVKSAVPGIDRNDVLSIPVAIPDVSEQSAIADYLDRETGKIDRMLEKVESAIDKLTEYRIALITAATTGKIDVRNIQIGAPV